MSSLRELKLRMPLEGMIANTPAQLIDPGTYEAAYLPYSAVVDSVSVYSVTDVALDAGVSLKVGTDTDVAAFLNNDVNTTTVNSNYLVVKMFNGLVSGLPDVAGAFMQTDADYSPSAAPIGVTIRYHVLDSLLTSTSNTLSIKKVAKK